MSDRYWFVVAEDGRLISRLDAVVNREVPEGAIPVSRKSFEQSLTLQRGQQCYYVNGVVEHRALEGLAAIEQRAWRNSQLLRVEWLRNRHRDEQDLQRKLTLTETQFTELLGYMQQLRDWPQSEAFPENKHKPVAPPWIATHV
ncbi:phage tail assembly chaperone [Pseudomonas vranovensis]|uniref:phage tail assembly chaperone n=1 Tax=Pseudomonas vranovensis TaxID=321661 RepID=UPI003D972045